ncbi:hypothetical protein C8Q78DRAFT_139041 [Trametes maxima]|nr:hypothetical protein C8Q78DRAFT_139041 [Trametes maxima]
MLGWAAQRMATNPASVVTRHPQAGDARGRTVYLTSRPWTSWTLASNSRASHASCEGTRRGRVAGIVDPCLLEVVAVTIQGRSKGLIHARDKKPFTTTRTPSSPLTLARWQDELSYSGYWHKQPSLARNGLQPPMHLGNVHCAKPRATTASTPRSKRNLSPPESCATKSAAVTSLGTRLRHHRRLLRPPQRAPARPLRPIANKGADVPHHRRAGGAGKANPRCARCPTATFLVRHPPRYATATP